MITYYRMACLLYLLDLQPLNQRILRGFLKLYFPSGELLIEGKLHMDLLSLFYTIMTNPQTIAFGMVKYILMMSDSK